MTQDIGSVIEVIEHIAGYKPFRITELSEPECEEICAAWYGDRDYAWWHGRAKFAVSYVFTAIRGNVTGHGTLVTLVKTRPITWCVILVAYEVD